MINNVNGWGIEKIDQFSFAEVINFQLGRIITVIFTLTYLLGVKIVHLIDMTGLFKISNLVLGGKEIVTSLYSSLEGKRQRQREKKVGRKQGFIPVTTRETALLKWQLMEIKYLKIWL